MKQACKRIASLVLLLALMLTMVPADALAAYAAEGVRAEEPPIEEVEESGLQDTGELPDEQPPMIDGASPDQPPETPEPADAAPPDIPPEPEEASLMASGTTSGDFVYTQSGSEATLTGYLGSAASVTVPGTLDGYTVTGIGSGAFRGLSELESIVLPDTVKSIGANAFYGCASLRAFTIPAGVTSIGNSAFYDCAMLEELTIPAGVTSIGSNAFCNAVKKITFENGMETIPSNACYRATNLTEAVLPDSVTKISSDAFKGCENLASVRLPAALTSIGSGAFYNCASLEAVTIPAGVTSIGNSAFYDSVKKITFEKGMETVPSSACYNATNLTEAVIPDSVTAIGSDAFRGCGALVSAALPAGLTSIGSSAFYGCSALTGLTIPSSVTTIGNSAFYNCSQLEEAVLPAGLTSIGSNVFNNSIKKITFADGLETIPANACYGATNLTETVIPDSVTAVGAEAFRNCQALASVDLPAGVTSIGNYAFYGCTALERFSIPSAVTTIGNSAFYNCSRLEEAALPAGLTSIGSNVFYNSIKKITFADGLETVPANACYGATNLTEAVIPGSVKGIGKEAFRGCSKLASVSLSGGLESIGVSAFSGCTALSSVAIPSTVQSIADYAFSGCTTLERITVPGMGAFGKEIFRGCTGLTRAVLEEGASAVSSGMFYGCTLLSEVDLPSTIRTIGASAFYNCASLARITMARGSAEDAVKEIGSSAFYNCTSMAAFDVPLREDAVIGNNAFYNCVISGTCGDELTWSYDIGSRMLTLSGTGEMSVGAGGSSAPWGAFAAQIQYVVLPEGLTSIAPHAFSGCTGLMSVVIPDSVTSIGAGAFAGCTSLERAEISANLDTMGEESFKDCSALDTVVFCGEAPSMGNDALPANRDMTIYYPQSSSTWENVAKADNTLRVYSTWDDTLPKRDIALVLDCSGSMGGARITGLKTAVNTFIDKTGGRLTNTRLSVIVFSDSAVVRTGFTTDVILTREIINSLSSGGGTRYNSALTSADTQLDESSADIKSLIFFSDGEPNDGTSTIYSTAAAIRGKGYFVYTVGLCSEGTSYEQILINVAGSENNYFRASDIDELAELFLAINSSIGEENATQVSIERDSGTYDLLKETQTFPGDSTEKAAIVVNPYWGGAVPGSMRLSQGGKTIAENKTGRFEDLVPAQAFSPGKPVYLVLLDQDGNIAAVKKLLLEISTDYLKIDKEVTVPAGKYCIHVVSEDGYPLSGAAVTWSNAGTVTTRETDSDGNALFDLFTVDEPVISVSMTKFITWTNENSNWKKSDKHYDTVILYPESASGYRLKSALYSNLSSMANSVDLLTKTKKVNLKNDGNLIGDLDFGNFYLTCGALEPDSVDRYVLYQNDKKIAETRDGNFGQLSVSSFASGGGCFIRVFGKDSKHADTRINLTFAENKAQKETGVSILKDKISITVSDDIPFLGGSTFNVGGVGLLPVEIKATNEKFYIGFNAKIWDSSETDGAQTKGKFDKFKKSLETMKKANANVGKRDTELMNKLMKMEPDFDLPGGSVKFNVIGYAEANWGSSTATGELYIVCRATTPTLGFTTWVVVVPVTVQISGYMEVKVGAKVSYNWEESTFQGEFPLTVTLGLDAFGGVGVGKAIGVGAYGSANVAFGMQLFFSPFLKTVDLTGDLGVKAYIGPFEHSRSFAHNTWHLYTANTARTQSAEGWTDGLQDASRYVRSDLSYLSKESGWLGGGGASLMDAAAKTSFRPLVTDTYRNAQPVMISAGGALYAAYIKADQDTGRRFVVLRKNDGTAWSDPVQADAGAILDSTPQLCADSSGTIWLAYARTVGGTDSLLEYAENQEIVVGRVDPGTLTFTEAASFDGNYTHLQRLDAVNGQAVLAWVDSAVSEDDDVVSPAGGTIWLAVCSGGTWSWAGALDSVSVPVDALTVGASDGAPAVAYLSGSTLYRIASGATSVLAENVNGRVSYGRIPGAQADAFIWNGDGTLEDSEGNSVPAEGITHEYAVVGSGVYYSMAEGQSANLAVVRYSGGTWSLPIRLTDEDRYLEDLTAASVNGQDFIMGMNTAVAISDNSVEDAKDLVSSAVMPVSDLRLTSLSYQDDALSAGDAVPVTLTVTNAGDHTVRSIDVTLNGSAVKTETCELLPGQSLETAVSLTCPSAPETRTLAVQETGADDYTPEDNTAQATLGFADVEADLAYQQIGDQKSLVAYVTNNGVEPADGTVVFYDADAAAVAEGSYRQLAPGDTAVVIYDLPHDFSGLYGGDVTVTATLEQEERYTDNNSASYYIIADEAGASGSARIVTAAYDGSAVQAEIECLGSKAMNVYCAWFTAEGKLLRAESQTLNAGQTNTRSFSNSGTDAGYAKVLVLDTDARPMCPARQVSLQGTN